MTNQILQDDEVFRVEVVSQDGQLVVKKNAKLSTPPKRIKRMLNDIYGMEFFRDLCHKHPELNLHVPTVYKYGDDFYVREYISGESVVSETMSLEQAGPRLDKLAKLLADIDRLEPYGEAHFMGSSDYRNLYKSIFEWTDENLVDQLINQADAERLKQISKPLEHFLQPRIAHGDMSAYKHAYFQDKDKVALIDFENFTPSAARYFDAAWNYTRLYSFAKTTNIPKHFLKSFITQAQKADYQTEQLMAVLIQRTLGMQKDADTDARKKGINFKSRARELLDLVLQNKLELLYS
jgi:predicted Ser/Thr protein kinase